MSNKVKVIPCSGMGKVFGLASREAALKVVTELCVEQAETMCLAYLVTGDDEAKEQIKGCNCITIDGCPKMCSAKNVSEAGGIVKQKYRVVDTFRKHRGAQAGTATSLTDEGWQIVDELADEIAEKVKELSEEE
ncbi:DGC domain protein [Clostridium tepidiprofundi DSM 19306]|uniref:DGC domain protein n=1 Tax=Clostridium tepidiprofundi DSM 19306 TaxID=1121338 RepID=A0A151B5V7_9CLOT|nr:putative zinc-binding protein [Clostridium tepidiprofundi]KYH35276.1 DGC domain protein [Clostridium tepidiprofundi DSM 19306]